MMQLCRIWGEYKASKKEWKVLESWWSPNSNCFYNKVRNVNTGETRIIEGDEIVEECKNG